MKTKMYSLHPVMVIAMIMTISSFIVKYQGPQMADLRRIFISGSTHDGSKKATMLEADITAYKKELQAMRSRNIQGQGTSYPVGCNADLTEKLALANLHLKYEDLITEQGYNYTEMDKMMCAVDTSRSTDAICHNMRK